jgi:hypothetical protein
MSRHYGTTQEPLPDAPPRVLESSLPRPDEAYVTDIPIAQEVNGNIPSPVVAEPMLKQPFPRKLFGAICLASIALIVGLSVGLSSKSSNVPVDDSGLQLIPVTFEALKSFRNALPSEFSDVADRPDTPAGKAFEWLLQHSELFVYRNRCCDAPDATIRPCCILLLHDRVGNSELEQVGWLAESQPVRMRMVRLQLWC